MSVVAVRPILFSGPMVRAILDGRKSVTRRVVNITHRTPGLAAALLPPAGIPARPHVAAELCPYGAPGDRLWVRETHAIVPATAYAMSHDDGKPLDHRRQDDDWAVYREGWSRCAPGRWRPSIHMPRWASRITLEVTEVRVERLQEITELGAHDEGVERTPDPWPVFGMAGGTPMEERAQERWLDKYSHWYRDRFHVLWDSINSARGHGWDANDWVWVVKFKRVTEETK